MGYHSRLAVLSLVFGTAAIISYPEARLDSLRELEGTLCRNVTAAAWQQAVRSFLEQQTLWYGHGTDGAEGEAFWLVDALCGDGGRLSPAQVPAVTTMLRRRVQERIPLAYVLGEAWFAGLRFSVDPRVLIPRSPLAEVIERGFRPFHPGTGRLLDLGTGSGCIALASAHHGGFDRIDAVDVDTDALAVAALNTSRLGLGSTVRVLKSDLFAGLGDVSYDIIVSNPPYVPTASMQALPPEYSHEPGLALEAGEHGLDYVDEIFRGAAQRLAPGGMLFLEVGEAASALERCYPMVPFLWLEFERGGDGVLALDAEQVREYWPMDRA
jgi:ribosomal protein L3 glutamine methyltransferase